MRIRYNMKLITSISENEEMSREVFVNRLAKPALRRVDKESSVLIVFCHKHATDIRNFGYDGFDVYKANMNDGAPGYQIPLDHDGVPRTLLRFPFICDSKASYTKLYDNREALIPNKPQWTPEEDPHQPEDLRATYCSSEYNLEFFQAGLIDLINKYNMENGSNTPDYILAQYLVDCLKGFNLASRNREKWYGKELHT